MDKPGDWSLLRHWFDAVCDLPAAERRARLAGAGVAADLAAEVLALCDAQTGTAAFAGPVLGMLGELAAPELAPGDRQGPWRIVSPLAEGGMGRVYVAERDDGQYHQRVALKRLRGLASAEGLERFRRERQILADLQHPHIARLLDGGTTEDGQPYLVMELVEGERIDRWGRGRPRSERLALFIQLCRTLAYAHARLVLHCDLKPSNVMVRSDGTPAVLDFGIARLLDPDARRAAETGNYLTPQYASPEQKRGEPLDTASDLFALGRILESLLVDRARAEAGTAPLEQLPPDSGPTEAALPADLAAIVARATQPDPRARYESAHALADDVQRYLERRPVRARAQTRGYRLLRYLQRHWIEVAVAAGFVLTVAAFVWSVVEQRDRALAAERLARHEAETSAEVIAFLTSIFDAADPAGGGRPDLTARELLDGARDGLDARLQDRPELRRRLATSLGWIYHRIGLPEPSLALFGTAQGLLDRNSSVHERVALLDALAHAHWLADRHAEAEAHARAALALARRELPDAPAELGQVHNTLGMVLHSASRLDEAESELERALVLREGALGTEHEATAATLHNLGLVARARGQLDRAAQLFERAQAIKTTHFGAEHPRILNGLQQLQMLRRDQGRMDEALALAERVLALRRRIHGEDTLPVATAHNELGAMLHDLGRYAEAIAHYRASLSIERGLQGEEGIGTAVALNNLASALEDRGEHAAAEPLFRRSLALRLAHWGETHASVARARHNLARLLLQTGSLDEAEALVRAALARRQAQFGEAHAEGIGSRVLLARVLLARDRPDAAAAELEAAQQAAEGVSLFPTARAALERTRAALAQARGRRAEAVLALRSAEASLESMPAAHPLRAELAVERLDLQRSDLDAQSLRAQLLPALAVLESALDPQAPVLRRARALAAALGKTALGA